MTAELEGPPALIETLLQQPRDSALFVVEESTWIFKWRGFAVSKKDHPISPPIAGGH
jgi:hypothetical protein